MMIHSKLFKQCVAAIVLAALSGNALAAAKKIQYVTVGNKQNPADIRTGFGSVAYKYRISKYETTIAQYAKFLNLKAKADPYGLYNENMGNNLNVAGIKRNGSWGAYTYSVVPGTGNRPISYVSWMDAARFCNWMHNGQGSGSTEKGAYTLAGATGGIFHKDKKARVWIPSENEWYKAAYYDPTRRDANGYHYWLYPTKSDTLVSNRVSANYYDFGFAVTHSTYYSITQNYLTDVGSYGARSASHYGTLDQGGNVMEWNDAVIGMSRGLRGSSWDSTFDGNHLQSKFRFYSSYLDSTYENSGTGFRIAAKATIPSKKTNRSGFSLIYRLLMKGQTD